MSDKPKPNQAALWSLILSIAGFLCIGPIGWIISLILAGNAKKQIAASGEPGEKMINVAKILDWIGIGLSAVALIVYIIMIIAGVGAAASGALDF